MKKFLLFVLVICLFMPLSPKAEADLNTHNDVFRYLKNAFNIQVSLSEQARTREEILDLLSPYFSQNYLNLFWNENIVEEDGKFVTYGTDQAVYYIPFFQYSDETKVISQSSSIYVIEFFPEKFDGPVSYQDHYEGLLLRKLNGKWKIDQYLYDNIPKEILRKAYSQ